MEIVSRGQSAGYLEEQLGSPGRPTTKLKAYDFLQSEQGVIRSVTRHLGEVQIHLARKRDLPFLDRSV